MARDPHAPFRDHLLEEVETWRRTGVISERAYGRILEHYGAGPSKFEKETRVSRLTVILSTLGGLLVGIGVILLVASNWEGVPRPLKVVLMTAALLLSLGAAYWARFRRRVAALAAALLLLSALVYGAAIFVVGQAYHVPAGDSQLLLLWGAGATAMGYAVASRGPLLVGILATGGWVMGAASDVGGSFTVTLLTVLVFGAALLSIGEIHRSFERLQTLAGPYTLTGLIVLFAASLFLSFSDVWDFFGGLSRSGRALILFWVITGMGLAATGAAARRWRASRPMILELSGVAVILGAAILAALTGSQPEPNAFGFLTPESDLLHPLLFNVVTGIGALWAVYIGVRTARNSFVNTALVFVGLLILARYFDFSFGLFDRSVVFIGAGLVLLVTAVGLDRLRRRLTSDRSEGENPA